MNNNKIKEIIKNEVIVRKENDSDFYEISGGGRWIFDFRRTFLNSKFLKEFSCFFWDKYINEYPFQIGGLETGAIPLISGIIMEGLNRGKVINSFYVRKDRNVKGLGKKIEGTLSNEKVIIVDDLFNSGKSIGNVFDAIKNKGLEIHKVFTFVNFGNAKGRDFLQKNNLKYDFEFTLSDFGLDIFGNSLDNIKENNKVPIIFPSYHKLFLLKNANKFIETSKSSPLKDGKNILCGGEGGKFVSICADTGNINWEFSVNRVTGHKNILSSPILVNDYIIFGSYDGNLYCINKNDGSIKWKSSCADWIGSSPAYSKKYNQVYIGLEHGGITNKGSIAGVDFNSGEKIWEVFYDDFVHCSPGYSEKMGLVLCGSNDGKLLCNKGDTGEIIFEKKFNSPIKGGFDFSPDGKTAYFGCFDNDFYSIDVTSGYINWSFKTNNIIYAKPTVIGNNIFIGSLDKFFYHLDSNGTLIKKIRTFGKIYSKPTIINTNIIAFGSNDSYIYFYDYINKKTVFVIEHKERICTSVIYDSKYKHLYVYDFLNTMYKYTLQGFID